LEPTSAGSIRFLANIRYLEVGIASPSRRALASSTQGVRWLLSIVEGMVREVGMPDQLHRRDLAVDPFVLAGAM
jgi:hypothetical protein